MGEIATIQQPTREETVLAIVSRAAADPAVDIDKLERLLQMQERIAAAQSVAAYNSDMASLQARMPSITKDAKIVVNGQVRANYASFEHIVSTIRPLLDQYGFSVTFKASFDGEMLSVMGRISHRAGHSEETTIRLPFDSSGSKNDVQAIGSSVSYGKRYALCMLLNIATGGEDDDGNAAQPKLSEKDIYANFRQHMDAVVENYAGIMGIKAAIAEELSSTPVDERTVHLEDAAAVWYDWPESVQMALWRAPSKGGVFTTRELSYIKEHLRKARA